jgi:hypothetical protein
VKNFLKEHPEIAITLEANIREKAFAGLSAGKKAGAAPVLEEDDF